MLILMLFFCLYRDTVLSFAFFRGRSLPETTTGMHHVCVFWHALALDEHRVKFLPEYVNGGRRQVINDDKDISKHYDVKEVWFAGHSDV